MTVSNTYNAGHNVLDLFNVLVQVRQVKSKQVNQNLMSNITNFVYELSHELQKDVGLRKLENIRKILHLGGESHSSVKEQSKSMQRQISKFNIPPFPYLVKNILSGIVGTYSGICVTEISVNVSGDSQTCS